MAIEKKYWVGLDLNKLVLIFASLFFQAAKEEIKAQALKQTAPLAESNTVSSSSAVSHSHTASITASAAEQQARVEAEKQVFLEIF